MSQTNPEEDKDNLIKYLLAGASLGLGGGLTAGVIRMLRNNKKLQEKDLDDDTIYLQKQSSISEGLALGLGVGGGGYLGYIIGDKIINELRAKEAQKALDEAQKVLLSSKGYKVINKNHSKEEPDILDKVLDKQLSKQAGMLDSMSTGLGALAAVLMLSGGVATYNYLDSVYPIREVTKGMQDELKPKKYKIQQDGELVDSINTDLEEAKIVEDLVKNSSYMVIPAFMLHSIEKKSSLASNVIATIAQGNGASFEQAVGQIGFDNALNLVKGASSISVDPIAEELSVLYCTKEASFSPQFNLLVAAEFLSSYPDMTKAANSLTAEQLSILNNFSDDILSSINLAAASDLGATYDHLEKSASENYYTIEDAMLSVINKRASSFLITNNNSAQASQLSGGGTAPASKKEHEVIKQEAQAYKQAVELSKKDQIKDPIDDALSNTQTDLSDLK